MEVLSRWPVLIRIALYAFGSFLGSCGLSDGPVSIDCVPTFKYQAIVLPTLIQNYEEREGVLREGDRLTKMLSIFPALKDKIADPWGRAFFICSDVTGKRDICSYGQDGKKGGYGMDRDFTLGEKGGWPSELLYLQSHQRCSNK